MWRDIRTNICDIEINRSYIEYVLEEMFEKEFSVEEIEKYTSEIEDLVMEKINRGIQFSLNEIILEMSIPNEN
jgi:hypothetical protein